MTKPYEEETPADEACARPDCGIRRDEHADQPQQSGYPALDITDHEFKEN